MTEEEYATYLRNMGPKMAKLVLSMQVCCLALSTLQLASKQVVDVAGDWRVDDAILNNYFSFPVYEREGGL